MLLTAAALESHSASMRAGADPPTTQAAGRPANLVRNGDFERRDRTGRLPADWTTTCPDNVKLSDLGDEFGAVVQMDGDQERMAGFGVDLLSETKIPIRPKTRYRCTGYTRSTGPHLKVFVRGYATVTRRVNGVPRTFEDAVYSMRKDIGPSAEWQPFNLDFDVTPADVFSDHQHEVEYVRIKLWAYWPPGTGWFDNIRFEEVGPLPPETVRHPELVTHTGRAPRRTGTPATAPAFDENQTWLDAANAFRAREYARAAALADVLVDHAQHEGRYRILAARALAGLGQWPDAERLARDFFEPPETQPAGEQPALVVAPWERDWAAVVLAEARWRAGDTTAARRWLQHAIRADASPHARQAAEDLRQRMESPPPR